MADGAGVVAGEELGCDAAELGLEVEPWLELALELDPEPL